MGRRSSANRERNHTTATPGTDVLYTLHVNGQRPIQFYQGGLGIVLFMVNQTGPDQQWSSPFDQSVLRARFVCQAPPISYTLLHPILIGFIRMLQSNIESALNSALSI